jgi:hypothetical protein
MKMSVGVAGDYESAAAYDVGLDPDLVSVGALKNSSVSMTPTFKEHQAGYPKILDFKIAELLEAMYTVEVEEINDSVVLGIIDDAIESLETGTPKYYAVEALAEFATGGVLSLFSPYAQLKASLNFNFGDDFSSSPFEFEALANPAYASGEGNKLVYRNRTDAGARNTANQPLSKNVANLGIGMFQVRVGTPSRRQAAAAVTKPARLAVQGDSAIENTAISAGVYTGTVDGAYIIIVTDNSADAVTGSVWYPGTDPAGAADVTGEAITGTYAFADGLGVDITLASELTVDNSIGDVWVVGVYSDQASDLITTGIVSPYSFLSKSDNVGAIQSASLETNPTYKDHFSGYPKIKDLQMLESSTVTINTALEEINAEDGAPLVPGYAVNLWDILFDASINGNLYNVPVEIVAELVTGGTLSFWFPNCQVTPEGEFAPGDEWASMPFALESQVQGALGTMRIYRQAFVQNV